MAIVGSKMDGGPGQVFVDGRESLGMTPEQAAESLNLTVKAIRAIETDDAGSLPDIVYVNGYIRSYAKLLGIAPEPLIAAWRAQHAEPENEPLGLDRSKEATKVDTVNVRPMKMGRWAVLAMGLSAAFVYFVTSNGDTTVSQFQPGSADGLVALQTSDREPQSVVALNSEDAQVDSRPEIDESAAQEQVQSTSVVAEAGTADEETAEAVDDAVVGLDELARDNVLNTEVMTQQEPVLAEYPEVIVQEKAEVISAQNLQETAAQAAEPAGVPSQVSTELSNLQAQVQPSSEASNQASSQAPNAEATQNDANDIAPQAEPERELAKAFALPRLTEFGDNTIDLTFSEDCWFEIRTAQGELLYADLGRSGQSRRYTGEAPFRLKFGFSPGVSLIYNDEPIDLEPYTRQEVARILLGEQKDQEEGALERLNSAEAVSLW